MYVKDWMTKEPVCLTREDSINLAFKAMKDGHFHRVPIVEGTKLVGLITESTLSDYTPSKATTLSVFEMNSIIQRTTCGDVMVKDVVTIDQNALLEEAADKMNVNNVACLPVVDDKNNVIGIITQKAIFGAFVELMGYYSKGSRIVVEVRKDEVGILKNIAGIISEAGINITHMIVYRGAEVNIVIRNDEPDAQKVSELLRAHGYVVTDARSAK